MIRFIHTADIHFGMENYGRIDPETGIHSRLLDFHKALDFCVDVAIEENVDFFLFAGDAYKTINPSPTQQRLLMQCLLRLYKANIPIVSVVGNHDNPLSFGKANTLDVFGDLPLEGFHVIAKPTIMTLNTKSGPIQIVGIPWPSKTNIALTDANKEASSTTIAAYIAQKVAAIITGFAQQLDPTIPAVLVGHLTVSSGIFSGSEKRAIYGNDPTLLPSQLAIEPFDYVALGHLHRYQNLNPNGYPAIVYAGSIERIDFGERNEDKGFCLVSIPQKGQAHHKFIKGPMRPFLQIEIMLHTQTDQTQQIIDQISKYDINNAVLKIIYHVPKGKKDTVDLQKITKLCAKAWHIVSISPVHQPEERIRRGALTVEMDFQTLLDAYFSSKQPDRKNILIDKAMQLYQEYTAQQTDDESN